MSSLLCFNALFKVLMKTSALSKEFAKDMQKVLDNLADTETNQANKFE
jgi:hypothetical protein